MSAVTGIAWCDSTLNFWGGCTKVSPACDHCYAERDAARFGFAEWGAGKPRKQMVESTRAQAEKWNDKAFDVVKGFHACPVCGWRGMGWLCGNALDGCRGEPVIARRRVFVNSWSDWLDNEVPAEWLADLLDRIRRCPNIDFLLLTKRIGNWRKRLEAVLDIPTHRAENGTLHSVSKSLADWLTDWIEGRPPANVWMLATVENQKRADEDIRKLLRIPAAVRGLSIEPMLGPINLKSWNGEAIGASTYRDSDDVERCDLTGAPVDGIHWIISGGESGPHARPSHPDWYRSLRDQCAAAGVAYLHKQNGEWHEVNPDNPTREVDADSDEARALYIPKTDCLIAFDGGVYTSESLPDDVAGRLMRRIGKKAAGRQLDGRTNDGFPK